MAHAYRILGAIEAIGDDGLACRIAHGRARALLGLLLVRRGAVVSGYDAVDALWADALPEHPENALHVVVARLRATLGRDSIVTEASGYALRMAPGSLDAEHAELRHEQGRVALAAGDPTGAAHAYREALELWRGPALADVRGEPFAQAEVLRLDELRLACAEGSIDAHLALGEHAEIVGELEGLVHEHPLHESFRAQLMRALAGAGRHAEALSAFRDARRAFVEAYGLEPSPGLYELQAAILRHEPLPGTAHARRSVSPARAVRRRVTCVVAREAAVGGDVEVQRRRLDRFEATTRDVYERYGGYLQRVSDGRAEGLFGVPVAREDAPLAAARAAVDLARLGMHVGIGTGEVIASGGEVLGDGVREAARLAGRAAPGEVRLDDATAGLVRHAVRIERVGRPGHYRLLALEEDAPAIPASPERTLVGRERDLGILRDAFGRASRGSASQLVTVLGEPGVGKSRLVRELEDAVQPLGRVLIGRCRSPGAAVAYAPLREMLEPVIGDRDDRALRAGIDPDAARAAAVALGLQPGYSAGEPGWAICALLAGISTAVPLVLVFEDIHWADPALLAVVERIVDGLRESPILVVCVARPELVETHARWANRATTVTLMPLSVPESAELLLGVAPPDMPVDVRGRIVDAAGGNPLFIEQLAAHVGDAGASELGPPPALQGLLDARLDTLPSAERFIVDRAAIEGEAFTIDGVAALADGTAREDVESLLAALVRRDLIVPVGTSETFRFRHALIAAAAYASIPKAERAVLHERFADALVSAAADRGVHLEQASRMLSELDGSSEHARELARSAALSLRDAAHGAHRRGDLAGEIGLLDRALGLLGSADDGAELLPALAAALFEVGDLDRAARVAGSGVEMGARLDLPIVRLRSEVERDRLRAYREPEGLDVHVPLASVQERIAELDRLGDDLGVARASYLRCEYLWMQGHPDLGAASAETLVERARRAGSGFEVAAGIHFMAWSLVEGATPVVAAFARCRDLERIVAGERVAALGLLGFEAVLQAMHGDATQAREAMAQARRGLSDLRLREAEAYMALFDGKLETVAGDPRAAERAILDARTIAGERGDRWFLSTVLVDLALAILAQHRDDDAADVLRQVEKHPSPHDAEWVIKLHIARGTVAARQGNLGEGLVDVQRAVQLADATEMLVFRADAWSALGDALVLAGRDADAAHAAQQAIALCHAKGNVAGARAREAHAALA